MKILVAISSVPDTTSKINFTNDQKEFDTNGIQYIINPQDEYCLSKALYFQEKQGAEVTIVTVGDTTVEPVMRKALAIGANNAIRVNIRPTDSELVAKEIAAVAKEGAYDLVLLGKESIDYNGGLVPGLVAAELDYPFANAVTGLEVEGKTIQVVREIDNGKETISIELPAVLAGQEGFVPENQLKIPNIRGIMTAKNKPFTVVEPKFSENKVIIAEFEKPKTRSQVVYVDKNNLDELVRLLHEEAKVI
ncbi:MULTISPECIES: electron transfer flavoprotein subunit beta/FixA family protein [unclassified Apibacter]|uniref:electron transfer flavoprotein subunit beta/FixA family protein n=1 Tax=unclassified Apibacter TaxID=2630820 RepID=UPI001329785C|nr:MULTISPECIES: electron transfer flavoprotein subunit beta/FixA family protein [unclassified Apibacter]MCX8676392.1 electron transfer flavoprotein subunit beta/FixA family protein [Apibacter sp. B3919]MXO23856.1 electron transfer flavoprotein beta subunit/FixA family protein [Apibacter sp. B3924]MXO26466.1 electron transfer flavoprotein beta subunit/FixA family protein [Apibacter sp. B3813]MXO28418.1 electron transfer flavoprotein beta subunit/FixA family protein [Apibacter sp. B3913]MXO3037